MKRQQRQRDLTNPVDVEEATNELAVALTRIGELLGPVGEAVDGYRADLERRGYSPTIAEMMAVQYHAYIMTMLTSQAGASK